jgi:hypothetical protein
LRPRKIKCLDIRVYTVNKVCLLEPAFGGVGQHRRADPVEELENIPEAGRGNSFKRSMAVGNDDPASPQGAGRLNGDVVEQASVNEKCALRTGRLEDEGKGRSGAKGLPKQASRKDDFSAGQDVHRIAREGNGKVLDPPVPDKSFEYGFDAILAFDTERPEELVGPGPEHQTLEKGGHILRPPGKWGFIKEGVLVELDSQLFELRRGYAGSVKAPNEGTHGCSHDDAGLKVMGTETLQNADMSQTTGAAPHED